MSFHGVLNELRGWQSFLGSALGFGGLILGALFNAHLNRKRDDRLRNAEAITIALSLYGEINLLRSDIAAMASGIGGWFLTRGAHGDDLPDYFREIYQVREASLYKALASKIGMLNPEILLPITQFYSDYETAIGHFPKLFKNKGRAVTYGPEWVLSPAIRAVEEVERAIRRIEQLGHIAPRSNTPSTGRAKEALSLIEDMRDDS